MKRREEKRKVIYVKMIVCVYIFTVMTKYVHDILVFMLNNVPYLSYMHIHHKVRTRLFHPRFFDMNVFVIKQ